jgi:hypothetical protein
LHLCNLWTTRAREAGLCRDCLCIRCGYVVGAQKCGGSSQFSDDRIGAAKRAGAG